MTKQTSISFDQGRKISVGQTYTLTNGNRIEIDHFVRGDRHYPDVFNYRVIDVADGWDRKDIGRSGDSTPNSLYWSINWELAA